MEELRKSARMQYEAAGPEVQQLAKEFFASMDSDRDEKVDVEEFLSLFGGTGWGRQFFKQLDADGNGSLDFWEVMTLYYAVQSGRPNCDHCGEFIAGIFFSCTSCFKAQSSFDLCLLCYPAAARLHTHDGEPHFLDNYTLLKILRDPPPPPQPQVSSSTTIARTSGKSKTEVTLRALNMAINIATATGSCTIS